MNRIAIHFNKVIIIYDISVAGILTARFIYIGF